MAAAGVEGDYGALHLGSLRLLLNPVIGDPGDEAQVVGSERHAQQVEGRGQLADELLGALLAGTDPRHAQIADVEAEREQIDERQEAPVGGLEARLRGAAARVVDPFQVAGQHRLRGVLVVQIEGGVDGQSILIHVHRAQQQLVQPAAHVFAEVGGRVRALQERGGAVRTGKVVVVPVLPKGALGVSRAGEAERRHLVEDLALQRARPVGVIDRRVSARAVELDHQHGGLGQGHVAGRVLEVELRRRLHPVGSLPEVHQIEIALHYLVLGEPALQLNRPPQFHQLAANGDLGAVGVDGAGKLLRDGGAARPETAADHVPGGANRVRDAESRMLEEVTILARQQRLDQVRRDLFDADDFPLLVAEELGDQTSVTVEYSGG